MPFMLSENGPHNRACFSNYMGPWFMLEDRLTIGLAALRAGQIPVIGHSRMEKLNDRREETQPVQASRAPAGVPVDSNGRPLYDMVDGIAVIALAGLLMKQESKYGGTSTVRTRQAVRAASQADNVTAILMVVDESPGGTAAGTDELAQDVAQANRQKPVVAHIQDLGASAAYYAVTGAGKIFATPGSLVGSIGTVAMVEDTSKQFELAGVKVYVVSTGPLKGAGADGTPVTPQYLAYVQGIVNGLNAGFKSAVMSGRRMNEAQFAAVSTGGVWLAPEAQNLGLIDKAQSLDETFGQMQAKYGRSAMGGKGPRMSAEAAAREIRMAMCRLGF